MPIPRHLYAMSRQHSSSSIERFLPTQHDNESDAIGQREGQAEGVEPILDRWVTVHCGSCTWSFGLTSRTASLRLRKTLKIKRVTKVGRRVVDVKIQYVSLHIP